MESQLGRLVLLFHRLIRIIFFKKKISIILKIQIHTFN